jgi:hypothetical protein
MIHRSRSSSRIVLSIVRSLTTGVVHLLQIVLRLQQSIEIAHSYLLIPVSNMVGANRGRAETASAAYIPPVNSPSIIESVSNSNPPSTVSRFKERALTMSSSNADAIGNTIAITKPSDHPIPLITNFNTNPKADTRVRFNSNAAVGSNPSLQATPLSDDRQRSSSNPRSFTAEAASSIDVRQRSQSTPKPTIISTIESKSQSLSPHYSTTNTNVGANSQKRAWNQHIPIVNSKNNSSPKRISLSASKATDNSALKSSSTHIRNSSPSINPNQASSSPSILATNSLSTKDSAAVSGLSLNTTPFPKKPAPPSRFAQRARAVTSSPNPNPPISTPEADDGASLRDSIDLYSSAAIDVNASQNISDPLSSSADDENQNSFSRVPFVHSSIQKPVDPIKAKIWNELLTSDETCTNQNGDPNRGKGALTILSSSNNLNFRVGEGLFQWKPHLFHLFKCTYVHPPLRLHHTLNYLS